MASSIKANVESSNPVDDEIKLNLELWASNLKPTLTERLFKLFWVSHKSLES